MGQDNNNFDRIVAIQKWIGEKLAADPNETLDNLERHMADPGQERLRPLFETFVGILPISLKAERGDVWGVAKGDKLWAKAYRDDFDTFYFNSGKVESGAHGHGFSYEVREDIIAVWDPAEPECNVIFRYDETQERWYREVIPEGDRVVAVRTDGVVLFTRRGGTMTERDSARDVSTVYEKHSCTAVHLWDFPVLDGVKAGEDWLVAWSRVDTTLTVHLVSGEYRETMSVEYTVGDPTVFAPMTVEGVFVNVTFSVESIVLSEKWHKGTRLFCVKSMKGDAVVNAFCIDGNTWQWNRRLGQELGGVITVNGKDLGIVYASGMEVKGSVVCVACAFGGKSKSGDPTSVLPMLSDGKMTHLHTYFDRVGWREQFASWPVVLSNRGVLSAVLNTGGELMVRDVLACVDSVHRNGQHLFVQTRTERNRWTVMTYDMNTLEQTGNSLNGRSKFNLATAVVAADGALFAAMQRSEKWVTVVGPRGQYGHDYHEVRDIAVVDGFVTFIGRVDGKVVRVRVPV